MDSTLDEAEKIARDYDESACEFCERYKDSGLSRSSRILLDFLVEEGLKDKSTLELGCGAGGFSMELINRGAGSAVGIDLSPEMVKAATELSRANGFEDRAKFEQGNAATTSLPSSDIVIMDKVICCYSDLEALLRNSTEASRRLLGFVAPRDEGVVKWPLRFGAWIGNLVQKRRHSILFYVHSLETIDKILGDSGFVRQKKRGSRFWLVLLYKRQL